MKTLRAFLALFPYLRSIGTKLASAPPEIFHTFPLGGMKSLRRHIENKVKKASILKINRLAFECRKGSTKNSPSGKRLAIPLAC
jgi:hypothetical protein